jgi:hypothetical protein
MSSQPEKKKDTFAWINDQLAEVGNRFNIRNNPKSLFLYTIFLSIMILAGDVSHIAIYGNISLVLAIIFLILAYASLEATRRAKKLKPTN